MKQSNHNLSDKEKVELYHQVVEYALETTIIHSNQKVLYINEPGAKFLKANQNDLIGANVVDVFTEKYRDYIVERIRKGTEERTVSELVETTIYRADGTTVDVELFCHPVMYGELEAIQSTIRDLTPQREAEAELEKMMRDVGTPIVPVHDGIAVIPLIGDLNEVRTEELIEIIPEKIQGYDLDYLIIDLSGIYNIDEVAVQFIYRIDEIMQLLGLTLIFTGFRPELARKSIEASLSNGTLRTMSNVKKALYQLVK
ncbi:PAS domain S-box protein [Paraliobacillus sp. X-1268]|uniref:PAS domain S-box protein n=1 Tax=Paraliobacillus sp. X-1268 TaxID=2213193 RepID=UPI001E4F290E|nr:PAS domain S-box protein [Paraliobacillus sp. X-1268]